MSGPRWLSTAEASRAFGVSARALRLYEAKGLVTPQRTAAGWRAYGPEAAARLHQVLALKRLGLSLAQVAALLNGRLATLESVLKMQDAALRRRRADADRGLALLSAMLKRLRDAPLDLDDLTQLIKETTMSDKLTDDELKAVFDPISARHFDAEDHAALADRAGSFDQAEVSRAWDALIAEGEVLMAKGDPASLEAQDLARRWKAQVDAFTGGDPEMFRKLGAVWKEAHTQPATANRLPVSPQLMAFIGRAMAATAA